MTYHEPDPFYRGYWRHSLAQGIPTEGGDALAAPFMGSPVAESDAPKLDPLNPHHQVSK